MEYLPPGTKHVKITLKKKTGGEAGGGNYAPRKM